MVSLKHEANASPEQHAQSNLNVFSLSQNSTGSFPPAHCSSRPPASKGEEEREGRGQDYLFLCSPDLQESSNPRISMKYLELLFYLQCVGQDALQASMM